MTDKEIKVYLIGEALKGAYTGAKVSRDSITYKPMRLADHILTTVNRIVDGL